ncbi:aspartate/glutamate racemase family protein [Pseudomonas oryzihabitans]|uniref:Aspartate racemase n=1 Tax=Pseudomonas oryzihabitans TaxID=47885 RepID=A0AAJ2EUW2_9PSED|nr:aspartate/glutamate racemase family protein [Pseudomonas psychrotolerans]MDR6233188.1 aspartate racemase [Pseudomonas psychrotolerans]MDR6357815.1 aspartate racemase [Pseudomonas psychrotolerans]
MRTLGLLGGMSWESSAHYYRILNEEVRRRLGGSHSAACLLLSVDFAEIAALQHAGDWATLGQRLQRHAQQLAAGGAEAVVLCTNTMHCLATEIEAATALPLLHIADPTGAAIRARGLKTIGLLGTAFTMEQAFYRERLAQRFDLQVLVPEPAQRQSVHRVIYEELVRGEICPTSREAYRAIIAELVARGAEGIVLGCTEIMLLVDRSDSAVPLFDTTHLHALAAVDWALA